ncbi:hypothetical protein BDW66DRAFT_146673 [Aspergillus desertorum]
MPSLYKTSPPSSAGSAPERVLAPATEPKLSLRSLFSRRTRAPAAAEPLPAVRTHSRQTPPPAPKSVQEQLKQEPNSYPSAHHTTPCSSPIPPSPSASRAESQPQSKAQAPTTWEDIDRPTPLLSFAADQSISSASIASRYHQHQPIQPAIPGTTPTPAMLTSLTLAPTTPALLPSYSDVSGAVVIDAYGSPRFLTPQEEQERRDALAQAVRERMLGLPRRTDFSWETAATPVLPRYEDAAVGGKLEGR